jgi:cell division protein FtsZ
MPKRRDDGTVLRREPLRQQTQDETRAAAQQLQGRRPEERQPAGVTFRPSSTQQPQQPQQAAPQQPQGQPVQQERREPAPAAQPSRAPRQVQFDDDDLDVPDFLK